MSQGGGQLFTTDGTILTIGTSGIIAGSMSQGGIQFFAADGAILTIGTSGRIAGGMTQGGIQFFTADGAVLTIGTSSRITRGVSQRRLQNFLTIHTGLGRGTSRRGAGRMLQLVYRIQDHIRHGIPRIQGGKDIIRRIRQRRQIIRPSHKGQRRTVGSISAGRR